MRRGVSARSRLRATRQARAAADRELRVGVRELRLDGLGRDEQSLGDLAVAEPTGGHPRGAQLGGGQRVAGRSAALTSRPRPARDQLRAGSLGERAAPRAARGRSACVKRSRAALALAARPEPDAEIHQCAGVLESSRRARQDLDRLAQTKSDRSRPASSRPLTRTARRPWRRGAPNAIASASSRLAKLPGLVAAPERQQRRARRPATQSVCHAQLPAGGGHSAIRIEQVREARSSSPAAIRTRPRCASRIDVERQRRTAAVELDRFDERRRRPHTAALEQHDR